MLLSKKTLSQTVAYLLLSHLSTVYAIEPGALNPSRPDYQLPPLPPLQSQTPKQGIHTQADQLSPEPLATDQAGFTLQSVVFDGALPMTDEKLQKLVAPYIGKTVTRLDLDNIRLQALQQCKESGLLYPSVLLPSQHISKGVVHYQVHAGKLSQVNIQGTEGLQEEYVRKRLQPEADQPLQRKDLQDRFQLLLTDPLIERVNGNLRPGANPGDAVLDLQVKRAQPYELHVGMDNYTPPTVGAYTGRLDGIVRNLTGWGDFLRINLSGSEGTKGIGGYFSMPLNAYDTRLNIGYQGSEAEVVDSNLKDLTIENNFMDVNIGLSHPVYRTLNRVLSVEGQFAYRQTHTLMGGRDFAFSQDSKDTVSVLRFIQNYLDRDVDRVISFRSSFNIGIDAFDASVKSDGQPDSRYFTWLGQLRYLQNLDERGTQFFMRGDVQLASTSLLPLERFALGGVNTVRGYRQNELVRDEGYAVALELRYPLLPAQAANGHRLNLVPFFDIGGAWNLNPPAGDISNYFQTLMSTGIGLQWSWQQFDADLFWARALSHRPSNGNIDHDLQDDGIYFRLHARIL